MPARRRLGPTALAVTGLLLCACSRNHEPPIGAAVAERAAPASMATPGGQPLYVGRWAATSDACAAKGWDLTATSLRSPTSLNCELTKFQPTSAGYTVYAVCTVGKAMQPTRLVFTLTGSGANRSLTLTGGPFLEPVGLNHCPDGLQAASATPPASSNAPA